MSGFARSFISVLCVIACAGGVAFAQDTKKNETPADVVPTHADAAVILAKFSGLFDRYVDADAGLSDCVAFLNRNGIYFGLLEVVNGSEFTLKDCARAAGQIELVLSGEAEFEHGKVRLPKGVDSWEEFCILNDVKYIEVYQSMQMLMQIGARSVK